MPKKVYKQKYFSVTIKNLNCEILTKNVVTSKRWVKLRMKIMGIYWKIQSYGRFTKNQYRWKIWLGEKGGGGCVFVGGVDNTMHTMKSDALLHKTSIKIKAIRLDMCTSMITLSKIAHQVWCNQPFSQINKTT